MAATYTRPIGLEPTQYLSGAKWNGQCQLYYTHPSNSDTIYINDLVTLDTSNRGSGTGTKFVGLPAIAKYAAGGTVVRGVVVGFLPQPFFTHSATASLGLKYRVASTARWALVVDDAGVLFEAEEINTGTLLTVAAIGKNIDVSVVAGDSSIGISKTVLDNGTENTTATLPLKLYRLVQREGNDFGAANPTFGVRWEVKMNTNDLVSATGL